jgi:hypothetical protein
MGTLTEEMKDFVLEWLGHKKAQDTKEPPSPLEDTWVMIDLKEGPRLGGRLIYYSNRGGGMDLCLTDLFEAVGEGSWNPSKLEPVEGSQCMIIGSNDYRYIQFLDKPPACHAK